MRNLRLPLWLAGLSHRTAWALLFGTLTWVGSVFPLPQDSWLVRAGVALDWPIALAGFVLPSRLHGIDVFFGRGAGHNMEPLTLLAWHLRSAVLVYLGLFYLPSLAVWAHARYHDWRHKKGPVGVRS